MKRFIEVGIVTGGSAMPAEQIIALLSELGFHGFIEEEERVLAYIEAGNTDTSAIYKMLEKEGITASHIDIMQDKNWNENWESNYQPVLISDDIMVRAPFHDTPEEVMYDIIIEPRMAFGTAHHETTSLMLRMISSLEIRGKKVLDMGCGTAVLAIMASAMGAGSILAVDSDEWAYKNSLSNVGLNNASNIEVLMGDASSLQNKVFDIIFANINRNILLEDIPVYVSALNTGGSLLVSGFYEEDLGVILNRAGSSGLTMVRSTSENRWIAAEFIKD